MTEALSGRSLEIAVAKALGITVTTNPYGATLVQGKFNQPLHPFSAKTAKEAYKRYAPHSLTDPVAFASVLAALEASGRYWHFGRRFTYWAAVSREDLDEDWIRAEGDTYQEAMCRAVVAWKGQA